MHHRRLIALVVRGKIPRWTPMHETSTPTAYLKMLASSLWSASRGSYEPPTDERSTTAKNARKRGTARSSCTNLGEPPECGTRSTEARDVWARIKYSGGHKLPLCCILLINCAHRGAGMPRDAQFLPPRGECCTLLPDGNEKQGADGHKFKP